MYERKAFYDLVKSSFFFPWSSFVSKQLSEFPDFSFAERFCLEILWNFYAYLNVDEWPRSNRRRGFRLLPAWETGGLFAGILWSGLWAYQSMTAVSSSCPSPWSPQPSCCSTESSPSFHTFPFSYSFTRELAGIGLTFRQNGSPVKHHKNTHKKGSINTKKRVPNCQSFCGRTTRKKVNRNLEAIWWSPKKNKR